MIIIFKIYTYSIFKSKFSIVAQLFFTKAAGYNVPLRYFFITVLLHKIAPATVLSDTYLFPGATAEL